MARGGTDWNNSDGLRVQFGTHTSDNESAGVHAGNGVKKTQTLLVTLADVTTAATDANTPIQAAQIKRGSIITDAYVQVLVAAAGSSSTLDIGLWGRGVLATPVIDDIDSIGVAIPQLDTGGTTVVGTPVGTVSLSDCVICVEWDTAAFTAGKILITVEYIEPAMADVAAVAL